MNGASIVAIVATVLGVASLLASGALYLTREHQMAPVINVQPAPVTVQQAPAPVVNVQSPVAAPNPTPAPVAEVEAPIEQAPLPRPRPKPVVHHRHKAKPSLSKWTAPEPKPFNLGDLFNAHR